MNQRYGLTVILLLAALVPGRLQGRYLNPNLGRFQTMDTYAGNPEDPQSLHKYTYAHADPVNNVDPTGAWASKATRVHQQAIDKSPGTMLLKPEEKQILKDMQEEVDAPQYQDAAHSYMHAMRDGDAKDPVQTAADAQQKANDWVRERLTAARDAEKKGDHEGALKELGRAMHTLQDSTSPAHHGFQPWYNYVCGAANPAEWVHASREMIYPFSGWISIATTDAVKYVYDNQFDRTLNTKPLPPDFFNQYQADTVKDQLTNKFRQSMSDMWEMWQWQNLRL